MKRAAGRAPLACAVLAIMAAPSIAAAHEFRPCLLDIRALGAGRYAIAWSAGAAAEAREAPIPIFPPHCRDAEPVGASPPRLLDCGPAGLEGSTISIPGLSRARVDALIRYTDTDGAITTRVLRADDPTFTPPATASAPRPKIATFRDYLYAGIEHILLGWDHLLFVLGLILLVKRPRPLFATITAFTVAHSLTLALSATGVVRAPQPPAEALIALSLMLLAAEIARPAPAATTINDAPQRPPRRLWVMAFLFGLLHGFGFAGALAELGLPKGEIPLALFAFNVGVELGQIAFILTALVLAAIAIKLAVLKTKSRPNVAFFTKAAAYVIGALAAASFLERLTKLGS